MTISSTTVKNSYSGNGTLDTFNYTFKIFGFRLRSNYKRRNCNRNS